MKNKDEQTGLVGLAIGAAVIGLVSAQRPIDRDSIVDELVRLWAGRKAMVSKMRFSLKPPSW